jgi:DNA primase
LVYSIPEDTISRVKNAANIVDVISEHVVLKKAGRNYLGLCPFHVEKTPSFTVSAEKQIFYCFGCHVGGNVFSFAMQKDGLAFPEAVRWVAGKYGIEVPTEHLSDAQKARFSENEQLFKINAEASRFFRKMLIEPKQGQKALGYLQERGMTREVIEGHQLGYAPDRWDGLLRHFQERKVSAGWLEKAGLVISRKSEKGHYDRFRARVIFPIMNLNRQVVGFGGRVMGDDLPKYLNSPETPVYNKRKCLYGIDKAHGPSRSKGRVYVVEGYFDVLAMHQYGFDNTVATLGTALTPEHVQLLKGMVGNSGQVFLVFDSDQAGIKAAQRSVAVFEEGFLDAKILTLPSGHDPDTFLRDRGPDEFVKAADKGLSLIPFIIDAAINAHGLTLEGKIKVVAEVQGPLASVQDGLARTLYIKQLAERLAIDEAAILDKIRESSERQSRPVASAQPSQKVLAKSDANRLEQQITAMMLCSPQTIPEIVGRNIIDNFEDLKLKEIARMIVYRNTSEDVSTASLISMIEDPGYRSLMARIAIDETHWDRQGCERVLAQFEARYRRRDREDLQRKIEEAERNKDLDLLTTLLRMKQQEAGKGLVNL